MLAVGSALTRRSLDEDARRALIRQVDLIAAQHVSSPLPRRDSEIGRFLATEEERLAILTPEQAELLLPGSAADRLRRSGRADGTVSVRGEPFLYAARLGGGDAIVLLRGRRATSRTTGRRSSSASPSPLYSGSSSRPASLSCSRAPSHAP